MNQPSLYDITKARNKCAQIILSFGEQYLPIFERLEKEFASRKKKQKMLERVRQIASENGTQNGTHLREIFRKAK